MGCGSGSAGSAVVARCGWCAAHRTYRMWTVLYLVNWMRVLKIEGVPWFNHTWSLEMEEQFYLLWPALLCLLVRRGGARRVFQVALVLALLSWAWRAGLQWTGTEQNRLYHGLDTRFDAPMWGCALAAWIKALFGRGLSLVANAWLTKIASILTGPIGWAITAIWTSADMAGPAYRVTIPTIIQVIYLRALTENRCATSSPPETP